MLRPRESPASGAGRLAWNILKHRQQFNRERYLRNLKNLPQEPRE